MVSVRSLVVTSVISLALVLAACARSENATPPPVATEAQAAPEEASPTPAGYASLTVQSDGIAIVRVWVPEHGQIVTLDLVGPDGTRLEVRQYRSGSDGWVRVPLNLPRLLGERVQTGEWRVRWRERERIVAETSLRVDTATVQRWRAVPTPSGTAFAPTPMPVPTPTPTPLPSPVWEASVPAQPIQPQDCFTGAKNLVEVGIRNAAGVPGQSWRMVVQLVDPAGQTKELGEITVEGNGWARTQFDLCAVGGTDAFVGQWTVRWVDAANRAAVYRQASFQVLPVAGGNQAPPPPPPQANRDSDGDGFLDEEEVNFGTDPYNPDTDGDGLSDGYEVWVVGTDPRKPDTDWDGVEDAGELYLGSDPWDPCDPDPFSPVCGL